MTIFLLALLFFPIHSMVFSTLGVKNKLGHSHASGGFPQMYHV